VPGYPLLVVDPSKVESVDGDSHAVTFKAGEGADLMQGAIVDTPAVGDISGDGKPEVVIGTNEEYAPDQGGEGPFNAGAFNTASFNALGAVLEPANGRVYAIRQSGDEDGDVLPTSGEPFLEGWPFKVGILVREILPLVGEGITGSPALGPVDCPQGGEGLEVGTIPAVGPGYVVNGDAESCYGDTGGRDHALQSDAGASAIATDKPAIPAFGHPAFGDLGGTTSLIAPAAGLQRALDTLLPEYQQGGQDQLAAWETSSGQFRPNWPTLMNDLQFLTGPSVGDIDGQPGEEVVAGSAHNDVQAFNALGAPASTAWPKTTSDWTVANPAIGSFGTLDTEDGATKVVFSFTRSGRVLAYGTEAPACSPSSWPRFHHDNANSGNYERDAVAPGRPMDAAASGGALTFAAPGDDLLCGAAESYEVVQSSRPIDERSFARAEPVDTGGAEPGEAGEEQSIELPDGVKRYVAVRAVDEQGNVGRPALVDLR
jgi:hypothetical protein